ncbi:formylglycine-generating enzyme family protein [Nannocystis pusilla]|uniref:formylglycine-generating enzyme family protein n=1 Tax=Nannocystis pusilla TaxID=889268 RepID=UPI003B7DBFEC
MVHIAGGDYFSAKDKKTHPLAPFWLDRTEVTVKSYRAFVAAGNPPPHAPGEAKQSGLVCTWGLPDNDELPINCIDWHQADAYCRWAGKRLPTAQEWGWAAQGRDEDRRYPWGDAKPSCDLAVIDQDRTDAVMGCGRNQPWPVGTKPTDVTRDAVLDMFGNVGEPTSSGFNADEKSTRVGKGPPGRPPHRNGRRSTSSVGTWSGSPGGTELGFGVQRRVSQPGAPNAPPCQSK